MASADPVLPALHRRHGGILLYNIIDSVFIGHGVGPLALSGLAVTFPIMNLTFALGTLVGIGGAAISSIRLGKKRPGRN